MTHSFASEAQNDAVVNPAVDSSSIEENNIFIPLKNALVLKRGTRIHEIKN